MVNSISVSPRHTRDSEISCLNGDGAAPGGATEQGPDSGDEYRKAERFCQVVVGPCIERLGLVQVAILGGQHEDRGPVAFFSEFPADLIAVAAREHDVENDEIETALLGEPEAVGAVEGHLDSEPFRLQAAFDGRSDFPVVLDQ